MAAMREVRIRKFPHAGASGRFGIRWSVATLVSGDGKASAVNEYDGVRMDEDGDFARRCTVPEPLLNETQSRSHLGLSLQLSNINSIEVLANVVFGISAAERHISTPWCRPS